MLTAARRVRAMAEKKPVAPEDLLVRWTEFVAEFQVNIFLHSKMPKQSVIADSGPHDSSRCLPWFRAVSLIGCYALPRCISLSLRMDFTQSSEVIRTKFTKFSA